MDSKLAVKEFKEIEKFSKKTNIRLAAEEWDEHWKILVATMMSAQTRDEVTIVVATRLFVKFGTAKKLGDASLNEIEDLIKSINYFRTKARHIKETCSIIAEHGLADDLEGLVKLPGVGRKTANVFLTKIGVKQAIAVDTHVHRISHKMKWSDGKTPNKVEIDLEKLFPRKYWVSLNPL